MPNCMQSEGATKKTREGSSFIPLLELLEQLLCRRVMRLMRKCKGDNEQRNNNAQ